MDIKRKEVDKNAANISSKRKYWRFLLVSGGACAFGGVAGAGAAALGETAILTALGSSLTYAGYSYSA